MCNDVAAFRASSDDSLIIIIALAAAGLLLLLILLALLIVVFARRRRCRNPKTVGEETVDSSTTTTNSTLDSWNDDVTTPSPMVGPVVHNNQRRVPLPPVTDDAIDNARRSLAAGGALSRGSGSTSSVGDGPAISPTPAAALTDVTAQRSSTDPLPGLGPERPRPAGPTGRYVYIPTKPHREPRGWAPASHAVPTSVKRTWGRAKAKMAAEQKHQGATSSASMFNISTIDEENPVASTMSLNY